MEKADALELADRPMQELSGGQRQKVYLAMALAQETPSLWTSLLLSSTCATRWM